MIHSEAERWTLCQTTETLHIPISGGDLRRLQCYLDRMNHAEKRLPHPPEPLDPNEEQNVVGALLECMEAGLSADEAEWGLVAEPWGDMVSWEVAEEGRRRGEEG